VSLSTDPLLYVVYHHNPPDPVQPDLPIPGNCPISDQSALLPNTTNVPENEIDKEEDVVDSAFKEYP
jgi:hypothetical protein